MVLFSKSQVLVPIDFSDEAFVALDEALSYVEGPSHLHAIHVLPRLEPTEPGLVWKTIDDQSRQDNVKKAFYAREDKPEYKDINFEIALGDPSSEIIDYAKANDISLIVIPSHGRTGIGRFLLGSVSERVIRFAHCPVLVLRR
ncbi:MAG: universal stress protein [Elainellaceae cyanobacterium]